MNVIGYIRVSTQGQAKEGYSLTYQRDEIEAYCVAQGWNLLHVYEDAGIRGAEVDEEALEVEREGFRDMLEALPDGGVSYVLVLNTNRLWRSDIVKVLVHRELKRYSVDVKSIEQPTYSIHRKDPSDFLINGLMGTARSVPATRDCPETGAWKNEEGTAGRLCRRTRCVRLYGEERTESNRSKPAPGIGCEAAV